MDDARPSDGTPPDDPAPEAGSAGEEPGGVEEAGLASRLLEGGFFQAEDLPEPEASTLTALGPYRITGTLGEGGAAVVLRAAAPDEGEVAVKLLRSVRWSERFEREVRLLASLGEADGVVPLLDSGESPHGLYLVMPFLEGGSLRERLGAGPLPCDQVVAVGRALAKALGRIHSQHIVHRDLKPENVLFDEEDRPLIADLGLAKHYRRDLPGASDSVSLTQTGSLCGTACYMAPEQVSDAKRVGPASDVFSLGALLYECLTGAPAFSGETLLEVMGKVTSCQVDPVRRLRPEAPSWLAEAVEGCLARRPEGRPSPSRLEEALRGGSPRSKRWWVLVGLLLGLSLLAASTSMRSVDPGPPEGAGWAGAGGAPAPAPAAPSERGPRATAVCTSPEVGFRSLATYRDQLYAGADASRQVYGSLNAWRGPLADGGLEAASVTTLQGFKGRLFASSDPGARVWWSRGGRRWELSFPGDSAARGAGLVPYKGALYVSYVLPTAAGRVFRSETGDPGSWQLVLGDAKWLTDVAPSDLVEFQGRLHLLLHDLEGDVGGFFVSSDGTFWRWQSRPELKGWRPTRGHVWGGALWISTSAVARGSAVHRWDGSTLTKVYEDPERAVGGAVLDFAGELYFAASAAEGALEGRAGLHASPSGRAGTWREVLSFPEPEAADLGVFGGALFVATRQKGGGGKVYRLTGLP